MVSPSERRSRLALVPTPGSGPRLTDLRPDGRVRPVELRHVPRSHAGESAQNGAMMSMESERATARDRPPEEASEDTSFARGLRVLLTIADRGEIRADELSALLDTPISTIYRYLRTLAGFGFVDRQGAGYRLGPRLIIGRGANVTAEELRRTADPVLRLLAEETGETAVIVRRVGLMAVWLHEVPSRHPLRARLADARRAPPAGCGELRRRGAQPGTVGVGLSGIRNSPISLFDNPAQEAHRAARWTRCTAFVPRATATRRCRSRPPSTGTRPWPTSATASGISSPSGRSAGPTRTRRGSRRSMSSPTRRLPAPPGSSTTSRVRRPPTIRVSRSACGRVAPTPGRPPHDPPTSAP